MSAVFSGIDHVQLAAPPGGEGAARRFFGELLGLPELPKPPILAARGGCWFQCGAQRIHIGVESNFRAAKKAHPGLKLASRQAAEALRTTLEAAGVAVKLDTENPGVYRFFADDPFGNRIEFVSDP